VTAVDLPSGRLTSTANREAPYLYVFTPGCISVLRRPAPRKFFDGTVLRHPFSPPKWRCCAWP